jgi:predicted DNA-binding transcriptional regulator AlpA
MRTDTNVASGDSTLAALMRQGVTVAHIVGLLQQAYPKRWQQILRDRLGDRKPAELTLAELVEFTDYVFWSVKQTGMPDPAAVLVHRVQLDAKKATENLCDGREHDGRVFRNRHEKNFFVGRLSPRQKEEWLRDYPDRWQTREEFLRDLRARARPDVEAEPPKPRSTTSATEVPSGGESNGRLLVSDEDKRQPDKPATNTAPLTSANPEATTPATAAAGDEIVIGERRYISERRVAAMLGCAPRTLQRWRTEGKGPPSTKRGRKVYYELNELQQWMDREKSR